jgi:hypothetical protein
MEYEGENETLKHYIGGTPDGIRDDAVLEIKCPLNSTKHFERILDPQKLVDEYLYQILGEMLVSNKAKALAVSYDPRFPKESQIVSKWVFLHDYLDEYSALQNRLIEGVEMLKGLFKQYKEAIQ